MEANLFMTVELPHGVDRTAEFHEGDRATFERIYREHAARIDRALGSLLTGVDRDTVFHEVFFRLLSSRELRTCFKGGDLGAWLSVVARNHALDFLRARQRREEIHHAAGEEVREGHGGHIDDALEARQLVEGFCGELPEEWEAVFRLRFVRQLTQKEAADALGVSRTTLAYREARVRSRFKRFLLRMERP
jgi:RNA polymerase sigma-70 factor (ECF subfamily)